MKFSLFILIILFFRKLFEPQAHRFLLPADRQPAANQPPDSSNGPNPRKPCRPFHSGRNPQRVASRRRLYPKSGQATAEIRFLHDTLFVAATCDSLQTLVWQYEEQLERQSKQTKEIRKEAERKSGLPQITILLTFFLIALIILYKFSPPQICLTSHIRGHTRLHRSAKPDGDTKKSPFRTIVY